MELPSPNHRERPRTYFGWLVGSSPAAFVGSRPRLPPDRRLRADRRQLGLRVNEPVAIEHRQLVLAAHRDCVHRADLSAQSAEHAAARPQDELAEFAVAFFRRNNVHFQAGCRANARTQTASYAKRLASVGIGAERWKPAKSRGHIALLFRVLNRDVGQTFA